MTPSRPDVALPLIPSLSRLREREAPWKREGEGVLRSTLRLRGLVERAADDLTGQCAGQLAVLQQYGAVDDHMVDADRFALYLHAARRQAGDRLARLFGDRVGIEDRDVGDLAGRDKAAVGDIVHQGGLAGQPIDRLLERHHLLLTHPVAEQVGARLVPVGSVWPAAAVAGADDRVLRAEDVLLRLRIVVAVDRLEAGLQA